MAASFARAAAMADLLEFPRYVDDPPTLLLWRIDDLIPVVVFGSIAILIDQPLLFLVGLLLVRLYGRFREGRADGYALHALYWAGLWRLRARTTPNPFIRIWLP